VLIATLAAVVPVATVAAAPVASGGAAPAAASVLYNSTVTVSRVGNLPSVGGEAYAFAEFGNQITLTRSARAGTVVITLSSWGCQAGTWFSDDCVTAAGARFTEPITLNVYDAPTSTTPPTVVPGARILSVTKTFSIPYRRRPTPPSARARARVRGMNGHSAPASTASRPASPSTSPRST